MQKFDDIITEKDKLKNELPKELEGLKNDVIYSESKVKELKQKLENNQKDQKLNELSIKENKEKMIKYETQLLTIKTNKEYKALNSEIAALKEKNTKIDDKIIELMESENIIKEDLEKNNELLEKATKKLKDNEDRIKRAIEKVERESEKLRNKRNEIAKTIPVRLVKRYVGLIKNRNRKAVVYNENMACSGCGFQVRPQLAIELTKANKYIACENCGRILVDKEFSESITIDE